MKKWIHAAMDNKHLSGCSFDFDLGNDYDARRIENALWDIFNDADLVLILPGGSGSISEFFAYLEEIRSNDRTTKLVLYNVDHQFDGVRNLLDSLISEKFNDESIYNYYKEIKTFEEFKEYVDSI